MFECWISGSLPKPGWLAAGHHNWPHWEVQGPSLREAQRDATGTWLSAQLEAGVDVVSDPEQMRYHCLHAFLDHLDGVQTTTSGGRRAMVPRVTGAPRLKSRAFETEARQLRAAVQGRKAKLGLPGPLTLALTVDDRFCNDPRRLAMEFAAALNAEARALEDDGVDVLQFYEPAVNVEPEFAATWGVEALERAIDGLSCATVVHICSIYGIPAAADEASLARSLETRYGRLFPLLARSTIDTVSIEGMASAASMPLLALLEGKQVALGVVDTLSERIEAPGEVAGVIANVLAHVPAERFVATANYGMKALSRDLALAKMRALVAGVDFARQTLRDRVPPRKGIKARA